MAEQSVESVSGRKSWGGKDVKLTEIGSQALAVACELSGCLKSWYEISSLVARVTCRECLDWRDDDRETPTRFSCFWQNWLSQVVSESPAFSS
jgi:hypothetical protein